MARDLKNMEQISFLEKGNVVAKTNISDVVLKEAGKNYDSS